MNMLLRSQVSRKSAFYKLSDQQTAESVQWMTPSACYHYMIGDPLSAWLDCHRPDLRQEDTLFAQALFRQGHAFECLVVATLRERVPVLTVSQFANERTFATTRALLRSGAHPILHSVPLLDVAQHIRGIADLVVRGDVLTQLFGHHGDPSPSVNVHTYYVIDVKFRTLALKVDGTVRAFSTLEHYRHQLWTYTRILGTLQKCPMPTYGYLLGRRCKIGVEMCDESRPMLGRVEFTIDSIAASAQAYAFQRSLPLSVRSPTMLPNLVEVTNFEHVHRDMAAASGDITQIAYCTSQHRLALASRGITSLQDPRCTLEAMGIDPDSSRAAIIESILHVNRAVGAFDSPYLPRVLSRVEGVALAGSDRPQFYIDFELIPATLMDTLESSQVDRDEFVYLIGIGHYDTDRQWIYTSFTARDLSPVSERALFVSVIEWLPSNARLVHWGSIERRVWESKSAEYSFDYEWFDACAWLMRVAFAVRGAFNYKLKNVGDAMYTLGYIQHAWPSTMRSGLEYSTWMHSKLSHGCRDVVWQLPTAQEALCYNELDVRVMSDIVEWIKTCVPVE